MRMPRFCLTWHEDAKASDRIGFVLVSGLFYDLLSTTRLGNSALEERKKRTKEGPAWSSSGQRRRILASAPSEATLLSPLR